MLIQRGPSPVAAFREDPALFILTLGAAGTSIAALLLHLAGIIRMPYTLSFLTAPGMIFLVCVLVWVRSRARPLIVNRLRVGMAAGVLGLIAYNAGRAVVGALLSVDVSPFYSIFIFGSLITGRPIDSLAAAAFGWLYHVSNGVTFGVVYTLVAGPARWWYGLGWGLVLELAMLLIYPASEVLRPPSLAPFIAVSLISHALFGAVIGLVSRRYALNRGEVPL